MSKGFRSADETQVLTEQATTAQIEEILRQDREQEARSQEKRSQGTYGTCENCEGPIGEERLAAAGRYPLRRVSGGLGGGPDFS